MSDTPNRGLRGLRGAMAAASAGVVVCGVAIALGLATATPVATPAAPTSMVDATPPPLLGASPVPSTPTPPAPRTRPSDAWPRYRCPGYSSLPVDNPPAQVRRDHFAWGPYGRTRVGDGYGDIDWRADPHRRLSWRMWLHSLRWLGSAIEAGRRGDDTALAHATAIARDWVRDNPYSWKSDPAAWESTMHRTDTLLCLRSALARRAGGTLPPDHAWLDATLERHAQFLTAHFSGDNNHGTDEAIALLGVGCTLHRPGDLRLAQQRLTDLLPRVIDAEGATNEQATGYAVFNYTLWGEAARALTACAPDAAVTGDVTRRRARLAEFIAHATTPLRTLHQIGNTERLIHEPLPRTPQEWAATAGARGRPPADRVKIYRQAGYVFGRSGWGDSTRPFAAQSAYALRFGPARERHGHVDHTSLTWQARGQEILTDPGYGVRAGDAFDAYPRSPDAHNQLVVPRMNPSAATQLRRADPTPTADAFTLADEAAAGVRRTREVIVLRDPDAVLVVDTAGSATPTTYRQMWHLPEGREIALSPGRTTVTADHGATRTTITSLPPPGGRARPARVVTGDTTPVHGWVWPRHFGREPAPVVEFGDAGTSTALVTAVTAARRGAGVQISAADTGDGGARYTLRVDEATAQVALGPDGRLTRTG